MNSYVFVFFLERQEEGKINGRVLDVGSYNVNGSLKDICETVGVDMRKGSGVDVVCNASDLVAQFGAKSFDTVLTAETFEHVEDWRAATRAMWDVLKPGGWLIATMASVAKCKHDYPNDYWRMTGEHIKQIWPDADVVEQVGHVSIGWSVQKRGPLPDLGAIDLLRIDDIEKAACSS